LNFEFVEFNEIQTAFRWVINNDRANLFDETGVRPYRDAYHGLENQKPLS
jgi:hypothetical protein